MNLLAIDRESKLSVSGAIPKDATILPVIHQARLSTEPGAPRESVEEHIEHNGHEM
jgi:hypothetical protein